MQTAIIFVVVFIVLVAVTFVIPNLFRSIFNDSNNFFTRDGSGIGGGILKSDNGGETWIEINNVEDGSTLEGDTILNLVFDAQDKKTIFVSVVGRGLFKSENRGESWSQLKNTGLGLGSTVYDFLTRQEGGRKVTYLALFENGLGSVVRSEDGENFERVYIAPLANIAVLGIEDDPFEERIYIGTAQGGLLESINQGESWRLVRWFPGAISLLKINPEAGFIWVYTNENKLFRSIDKGESWAEFTSDLSKVSREATDIRILSFHPTSVLTVYLGTAAGLIKSEDNGLSWFLVPTTVPPEFLPIQSLAVSVKDPDDIFLTAGSQVHRSFDDGQTWSSIQLPAKRAAKFLVLDPLNNDLIYVGF